MEVVSLKGQPIHTVGALPKIGSQAPDLRGVDPGLTELSLKNFEGKKKVICFVPSLDTPICSTSAKTFNQKMKSFLHAVVIYCSMDLPFAFKRICMNEQSHYDSIVFLSLFRHRPVAEAFGIYLQDGPIAGLCARAVFVLDEKNIILYRQLVSEITEEPDYAKAIAFL